MSRRRRKNPFTETLGSVTNFGTLAFLGVGVYLLYKFLSPAANAAGSAYNSGTSLLASLFPGTSPSVQVQGTVSLLNGQTVPMSSLQSNGFNADGSLNVVDASGNSYSVVPGGNGTYLQQ